MKHLLLGAACTLLLATGAQAKPISDKGLTVKEIQTWLMDGGYKAEIVKADKGEDYIKSAAEGTNYQIYMEDCDETHHCRSLQFSTGFNLEKGTTAAKINEWNSDNRYVKAYIDGENDPYLQYDANLAPGGTYEALDDDFAVWRSFIPDFKKFIGWD
jgi:hypothetical protein